MPKVSVEVVIEIDNKIISDVRVDEAGVIDVGDKPYPLEYIVASLDAIKEIKSELQ